MRARLGGSSLLGVACVLTLAGCPSDPVPGNDSGSTVDSGLLVDSGPTSDGGSGLTCPSNMIPNASEQMLPCCYRASQEAHQSMPELRLRYLHLTAPVGSALITSSVQLLLNSSLANETFNWLIRGNNAGNADGPMTIQTGYGTRDTTTGVYSFSTMTQYAPVTLNGTITGEVVTTGTDSGVLTVPVFDPTGVTLQVELALHNVQVVTSTFSSNRSCIGALGARGVFTTPATLSGFLTIEDTRGSVINVDPIHAELCTLVASHNLADPGATPYCDPATNPQSAWSVKPNSICPATGACRLDPGDGSVCNPDGTGASPCNAWQLVSEFAAVGVEITP